jgi:chromosome segregation ATPase
MLCIALCRLRMEVLRLTSEASASSTIIDELRRSLRSAEDSRDASAQRTQAVEAALVERDGALSAVRSQLASSETNFARLQSELAAATSQISELQRRMQAQGEDAAMRLQLASEDAERRVKDALDHPSTRLDEAVQASEVARQERQCIASILDDHLAAESEIAVWYLHSGARMVPARDVARSLAALLEETRARIDEGVATSAAG